MLLLESHKLLVNILRLPLGYVVQSILVYSTRSLRLFALLLKFSKLDEELLLQQ